LKVTEHEWFNEIVMLVIVMNSIAIALYDHSLQRQGLNQVLFKLSVVFCSIYTLEAIARIIANGFVIGKNTYLRSLANAFDFLIVVVSIAQIVIKVFATR